MSANAAQVPSLRGVVTEPRLAPYLARYDGRENLALRLYAWNLELSAAFWGPLSIFEIALRNRVQQELPYAINSPWTRQHLLIREERKIDEALDTLTRKGLTDPGEDDLVAELSLGFWVGLFDHGRPHDRHLDYDKQLWQPYLHRVFPHRGETRRRTLHGTLSDIRLFRNRCAHHEPIWHTNHARMLETLDAVLGMIAPDLAEFVADTQQVAKVLDRKQAAIAGGESRI